MAAPLKIDNQLRSWATVRQLEYIEAVEKHGSIAQAGKHLKVDPAQTE